MTLEQAIQHCKEVAEQYEAYGIETECYECVKEHRQIAEWLEDYKELLTVNTELKRLLRLAVDDLDKAIKACETDMLCEICSYEAECNCLNYCFVDKNLRSWKHHDEAMKLLGGAENAKN